MLRLAPFFIFLVLVVLFTLPLVSGKDPSIIPSALIGKPAPRLLMPEDAFGKKPALVNFFASWCPSCAGEQQELAGMAKDGVAIYGVDYKDKKDALKKWLDKNGNPYKTVIDDKDGRAGIEWGITGVPETFLVDKSGVVVYRYQGPITRKLFDGEIRPLLEKEKK